MTRRGFTMIEMLVAILLTATVAVLAHALLEGTLLGAQAIDRAAATTDGRVAGRAWTLEACRSLEVGTPGAPGFLGTSTEAKWGTRVMGPDGWVERTTVTLAVERDRVTIRAPWFQAVVVDSVASAAIEYLIDGDSWMEGWSSPVSAPRAIRLRWQRMDGTADALLCTIGGRG
jgi:prepilin-type N-terminal cleavage/methylation domain-containing protein